jgi:hypothetical protein
MSRFTAGTSVGWPTTIRASGSGARGVATWADTATVLAADLLAGNEDPRRDAPALLRRALAALPAPARTGRIRMRADAGYFAGQLARAALFNDIEFAIGARRIAPLWRILDGIAEADWTDAIDMPAAQVAVADYCPNWWPASTQLLIRRVRLDIAAGQVSADPRARRRRTLHPEQRVLPLDELAELDAVYGYSFVVTNLDVATGERAAAVEHWYRHRTQIENVFRDAKHGAALRHLPSGYPEVNRAWMWGALLAATLAGWLHQLTARTAPDGSLRGPRRPRRPGHDRHPAAPTDPHPGPSGPPRRHAHPAPATRTRPAQRGPRPHPRAARRILTRPHGPDQPLGTRSPEATLGPLGCPQIRNHPGMIQFPAARSTARVLADSGLSATGNTHSGAIVR